LRYVAEISGLQEALALPSGEQLLSIFNALATQLASNRTIESHSEIPTSANADGGTDAD
jgi:hypothetical protein